MNRHVFNISILVGVVLVGVGVGLWSLPAGLAVSGFLIIGLTLVAAQLANRTN